MRQSTADKERKHRLLERLEDVGAVALMILIAIWLLAPIPLALKLWFGSSC